MLRGNSFRQFLIMSLLSVENLGFAYGARTIFSGLGFVAFTYGKRMRHWIPMICGLILMLLPLFVADLALLLTSALLGATAIVFRDS